MGRGQAEAGGDSVAPTRVRVVRWRFLPSYRHHCHKPDGLSRHTSRWSWPAMANFAAWEEFLGGFGDRGACCGEFPPRDVAEPCVRKARAPAAVMLASDEQATRDRWPPRPAAISSAGKKTAGHRELCPSKKSADGARDLGAMNRLAVCFHKFAVIEMAAGVVPNSQELEARAWGRERMSITSEARRSRTNPQLWPGSRRNRESRVARQSSRGRGRCLPVPCVKWRSAKSLRLSSATYQRTSLSRGTSRACNTRLRKVA